MDIMVRMNILAGMSGLKAAADMTKALRDAIKSGQIKADEIAGRIGEIYDYIIDSKAALLDAQEEMTKLRAEVQALNDEKEFRDGLTYDDAIGVYRRSDKAGRRMEIYCAACLDQHNKRIRVTENADGVLHCHVHGYRG